MTRQKKEYCTHKRTGNRVFDTARHVLFFDCPFQKGVILMATRRTLTIDCKKFAQLCRQRYMLSSDLAHESGITIRTIARLLYTGVPSLNVQIRTAYRLAQALHVPVDSILYQPDTNGEQGA